MVLQKTILGLIALILISPSSSKGAGAETVKKEGQHATLKLEKVLTGNLQELNGKYKIRVALVTYDLGGYVGNHHHAGPGLRCVTKGNLTYVQEGVTNNYGPGDCFYESGNVDHHAFNKGDIPVELYNFQILPEEWNGSSAITVTSPPSEAE